MKSSPRADRKGQGIRNTGELDDGFIICFLLLLIVDYNYYNREIKCTVPTDLQSYSSSCWRYFSNTLILKYCLLFCHQV